MEKQKMSTRYMAVIPDVMGFLSYEPKDAIIAIAGFIYGPAACLLISVIVSFVEMITISSTGPYGMIMNIVSTCAFTIPAACVYKRFHTQKGAVAGLTAGVAVLAAVMVLWNYIITPLYMGQPREVVAGMLATVFLPFNLIKGGINAGLTLLLYKPVVTVVGTLRKARLVEPSKSGKKGVFSPGFTIFSAAVLITFVLLFLVMLGVI